MNSKTSGVIKSTPAESICWNTVVSPSTTFVFTVATVLGEESSRPIWLTRDRAAFLWSFVKVVVCYKQVTELWTLLCLKQPTLVLVFGS